MNTVTKTALANIRQNKGRNILCGIAIGLTTLLIFVVLTVGFGLLDLQYAAVNEYYPTWHVMYRGVTEEGIASLKSYNDIEKIGLREDFGQIPDEDATITMLAYDENTIELNKVELESGEFPTQEKDIVVSKNLLKELGLNGEIGDEIVLPYQLMEQSGLGYEETDMFRICGFVKDADGEQESKRYAALFSTEYMKEKIPEAEREYRVMLHLAVSPKTTVDAIEARYKEIGKAIHVDEYDIVDNRDYLMANYRDPSTYPMIAGIIAVIVLAGILTIYSIYYVSMIPKVQEYGKLKAMGATKKQIRQIVFREGLFVALLAMPAGLLVSSVLSKVLLRVLFESLDDTTAYASMALDILKGGKLHLLKLWIYLMAIAVTLVTVTLSLVRPMQKAAKISPIEAMRYNGEMSKKKTRKGYRELNLFRLTKANLERNKKRTLITILTLSATGIFFVVVSTILSCGNPKEYARQAIEEDYRINIDSWSGDKMNPDREWASIMQNNPMNEAFLEEVKAVPGVEAVRTKSYAKGDIEGYTTESGDFKAYITGLDESYADEIEKGLKSGSVTYKELQKGDKIILDDSYMLHFFPKLTVGDSLNMELEFGDKKVKRTFEIAGIADYKDSLIDTDFLLPQSVLEEMTSENLTYICEIKVDEKSKETSYQALKKLADNAGYMETTSYEEILKTHTRQQGIMSAAVYAFLLILGGIGIMNLVNTMVNSIYTRRRELGMMQAIGLSEKQLIRMLQMEGMFYTAGVLVLSLGVGSAAGYGAFLWAKTNHIMDVKAYYYPATQAIILVVVVALIQFMLTYMITRNFRKQTLIERVRYSE